MVEDADKLALAAMLAFRRADKALKRREGDAVRAHGLTPAQFGVLECLQSNGEMRVGDLIDQQLSTSGNMTVVIRNMERDGFVTRKPDPADGRAYLICLTDAGRRLIGETLPDHVAVVRGLFSGLDANEKRQLAKLLRKLERSQDR